MRKEYDLSGAERGKFFGKVDTQSPVIEEDDTLEEALETELLVLESNLGRIKMLRSRLAELDSSARENVVKRISEASDALEEMALSE
ncbi:MAG: hypothetical protein IT173_15340 [Acidobacteria bacterium]|nr:hypothetical protein [Acidobacteriota bacterium]